jgi:hypothetical protein
MDEDKLAAFLEELGELTKKHGLVINGCGECGSPWVEELKPDTYFPGDLQWDHDLQTYVVR